MKKILLSSKMLILLLSVSIVATGQYTGSFSNVAAFKTVLASDSVPIHVPAKAVDILLVEYASIPGDAPAWIQIDLGSYHLIDGFGMVVPNAGELPSEITVQASTFGSWWLNLGDFTTTATGTYYHDITPRDSARYFRLYITAKDSMASFAEIYVYGEELLPPFPPTALPVSGITPTGFTASWTERTTASGYTLSVATDDGFINLVPGYEALDVGNVLSWDVTGLSPVTTYYYQVSAYNITGTSAHSNEISATTLISPQTITFDSLAAYTYGDPDFALGATATSGLPVSYISSDETVATITGSTVIIVGAGTTSITASQAGDVQYLPADPVVWDLVVNIKTLTVSGATAADKTYDGTTDATVSGASLAGVVGADDVTLSGATTGTFAQADAGTGIAVSTSMTLSGLDIDNYGLELPVDITADITAKDLTVTADDKSREECAVNPEFTVTYSGFADAEDAGVLNSEAVASCSADETSAAGAYDITVTGGSADNYNLVYVTGTLTVTLDITVPMLTVQNVTVQLDDTDNAMITAADVVTSASDNCTIADTTLSQSSFTVNDIGDVTIDVTVTDMAGNETTETAVVTVEGATGIAKLDAFDTRFYPNPTDGMLYFDLDYPADELKVMDMTGKTIIKRSNLDKQDVIDLSEYNSGIYLIQLKSGEALLHFKVVRK